MIWKIGMPNLSHTMEHGTVLEWLKKEGEPVAKGDILVVVESDKATYEVESPGGEILLKILAAAGTIVPVGATIGIVGSPGEALPKEPGVVAPAPAATPVAAPLPSHTPHVAYEKRRLQVSPAARNLARQLGVDLEGVTGTGPGGLITKEDVSKAAERPAVSVPPEGARICRVALSGVRKTVAQRMQRSWQQAPMVTLFAQADVSALLARRIEDGSRVGINDLLLRAVALVLTQHPRLNAWFIDEEIREVEDVNLGFAVTIEDGLVVPVIRAAQRLSVYEIGQAAGRLAQKAKSGRLSAEDLADGTFTVSNLGPWGIEWFTPIINPPQIAILGVGSINRAPQERPMGVAFINAIGLCLVFDHRAIDGAGAAAMLQTLCSILGDPDRVWASNA